ncbi:MAG: AMP-binding protein [Phenylobacterium sp.]|uniref:AMP-binding protein n=1 Tax=Phenylobacterium sp. TaxID=1871053 RepID=UPI002733F4BA|nr:AMP-binding protein [Phenylobacterium sp.]MDP3173497.1 AMP-binding protein [Phenylobacterium sp.]
MATAQAGKYEQLYGAFQWRLPTLYNMAHDVCDRHAEAKPDAPALIHERTDGQVQVFTFKDIQRHANQLANVLTAEGLQRGDRIMVLLGQDPATAITHVAAWKAGMMTVPTSCLFGADALEYRFNDSGARAVVTDVANFPKILEIRDRCPDLRTVLLIDGQAPGAIGFWESLERASDRFETLALPVDTPAFISYTSGTTGLPKGTVHGHRTLLGHRPGVEFMFDFLPQPGDLMWTPADWAWLAGLFSVLMPTWAAGVPVLTYRARSFNPEEALQMMSKHKVRTTLLTPTMLKLVRQVPDLDRFDVNLRSVVSGSESVGKDLLEWASAALKVQVNEGFGQTECNMCLGNSWQVLEPRIGSLCKPVPGMIAGIVDDAGNLLPPGTTGNLAFKAPHPVMLLEYWNNPKATAEEFAGDWMLTGDLGRMDDEGYYWFGGRGDDVITSAGYRIGPGEIEDALLRHPAVVMAAAIGVPDAQRTEIIKAFIVLADGHDPSLELADEIRNSVRERLARHEYPREIAFVKSMPMTNTGKILRRELRAMEKQRIAEQTAG